ncbi:4-hydroxybenzoate 3-monooxygenase [Mycolicibacterium cosmeticum]|uniref:3-(3-hydroxyphenyl)propionate hydroxylase n=1 Tax=Mycolicibacterium cosmeticum TaxID=258533 RepID=W9AI57_MYCCO|nr:4-hydroxybenzoate 3-monooxygenase [Mycolicibacterium cosmeticum]TLH72982.1 4-hydroxybenzoate 3-monooxygenase [Mycolicibacterium cosmeticum]CDO05419.1 3-(3-hydroxyphenyl)propionate hydroxylase [Mycolicibacterium cosmeticum]
MHNTSDRTTVAVIGAGVAGLALGNFLLRKGIGCVIVERHSRDHVEGRQRAGSLDGQGVRILGDWDLHEVVGDAVSHSAEPAVMPLYIDGRPQPWAFGDDEPGVFCPQQVLVRNLIGTFLRNGGDLRFGADDVAIDGIDGARPSVHYRDADGVSRRIGCEYVAGCDGDRGVSRTAIPAGVLTRYAHEHGFAWLAVLADVPADPPAVMAVHRRGFAAHITRGAGQSRFYLQCPLTDTLEHWPDTRIWSELEARFGRPVPAGPITDRQLVPLRGVVYSPMSFGRLFLLGDAAHIVSPMSAKGMSLALHDADLFARALSSTINDGDPEPLASYSDTCLRHTWDAQTGAVWITDVMHDAGDAAHAGAFRQQLARAELRRMLASAGAGNPF